MRHVKCEMRDLTSVESHSLAVRIFAHATYDRNVNVCSFFSSSSAPTRNESPESRLSRTFSILKHIALYREKKIQWARIEDEYKHMLSVRGLESNLSNNRKTVAYSHQPNDWLNIFSLMWTLQPVQWVGSQLQWCFTKLFNRIHQKTEVEKKNSIRLNNLWLFINKSTNAK